MNNHLGYLNTTANSIANAYMLSNEKFSKLNAKEFVDIYLNTYLVARKQIEIRIQQEKEKNKIVF